MPDWSYHPVFRPLLFQLPATLARDLALGSMGRLARFPGGTRLIELMGHMRPDRRLRTSLLGTELQSRLVLGPGVDVNAVAVPALARFGFALLQVGPVTLQPPPRGAAVVRRDEQEAIWYPDGLPAIGCDALLVQLDRTGKLPVPLAARIAMPAGCHDEPAATSDCRELLTRLSSRARFFVLDTATHVAKGSWSDADWRQHLQSLAKHEEGGACGLLLIALSSDWPKDVRHRIVSSSLELGVEAFVLAGRQPAQPQGELLGRTAAEPALQAIRDLRAQFGRRITLIAGGGIHEPQQALNFLEAGSDLLELDSGLVYSGPGLPKRINEALLHEIASQSSQSAMSDEVDSSPRGTPGGGLC